MRIEIRKVAAPLALLGLILSTAPTSSADFPTDRISGHISWNKTFGFPATRQPSALQNARVITVRAVNPCARFTAVAIVQSKGTSSFGTTVKVGEVTASSLTETSGNFQCFYFMDRMPGGQPITVTAFLNNPLWMPGSDPRSGNPAYDKTLQAIGGRNVVTLLRSRPDFPATATVEFQMVLTPRQVVR